MVNPHLVGSPPPNLHQLGRGHNNWYQSRHDPVLEDGGWQDSSSHDGHGPRHRASPEQPPQPFDHVLGAYGDTSSMHYGSWHEVPPEPPPKPLEPILEGSRELRASSWSSRRGSPEDRRSITEEERMMVLEGSILNLNSKFDGILENRANIDRMLEELLRNRGRGEALSPTNTMAPPPPQLPPPLQIPPASQYTVAAPSSPLAYHHLPHIRPSQEQGHVFMRPYQEQVPVNERSQNQMSQSEQMPFLNHNPSLGSFPAQFTPELHPHPQVYTSPVHRQPGNHNVQNVYASSWYPSVVTTTPQSPQATGYGYYNQQQQECYGHPFVYGSEGSSGCANWQYPYLSGCNLQTSPYGNPTTETIETGRNPLNHELFNSSLVHSRSATVEWQRENDNGEAISSEEEAISIIHPVANGKENIEDATSDANEVDKNIFHVSTTNCLVLLTKPELLSDEQAWHYECSFENVGSLDDPGAVENASEESFDIAGGLDNNGNIQKDGSSKVAFPERHGSDFTSRTNAKEQSNKKNHTDTEFHSRDDEAQLFHLVSTLQPPLVQMFLQISPIFQDKKFKLIEGSMESYITSRMLWRSTLRTPSGIR